MYEGGELAIINARVWTGNPRRPWADAVLTRGERIALVGSSAEVRKASGASCRRIDARGMLVVPLWKERRQEIVDDALIAAVRLSREGDVVSPLNAIEWGAHADLAMLDRDVTRATLDESGIARVVFVIVAGEVMLDRRESF